MIKITLPVKTPRTVFIQELKVGDMFRYADGSRVYQRVCKAHDPDAALRATCLHTGYIYDVALNAPLIPLEGELTVTEP